MLAEIKAKQSSLPSAGSELSLPEGDLEWPNRNHINIGGEKVELRRKPSAYMTTMYDHAEYNIPLLDSSSKDQGGTSPGPYVSAFQKPQEPSIDFELDVKVFVNSGKCVLHTKDPSRDDELKLASRKPVDLKDSQAVVLQKGKIWEPALVLYKHEAPRSYIMSGQRGNVLHRNTKHLRQSKHQPRLTQEFHTDYQGELQNTTDGSNDTLNEASNTTYDEPHHSADEPVVDNAAVNKDRSNTPIDNANDSVVPNYMSILDSYHIRRIVCLLTQFVPFHLQLTKRLIHVHQTQPAGNSHTSEQKSAAKVLESATRGHVDRQHVHYESKILHGDFNASPRVPCEPLTQGLSQAKKSSTKKASLFAWMTLQSIPEETIISPHILEFLEQTLEPIPSTLQQAKNSFPSTGWGLEQSSWLSGACPRVSHWEKSSRVGVRRGSRPVNTMFNIDQDSSWVSAANTGNYVYASFPVDVIVYFHMQPSTFRFSCLPVSRVECMLQLPSLDLVFSSKRAEEELNSEFSEWKNTQPFRSTSQDLPASRFDMPSSAVGGLSVTGCLADFSVYIFHPYGGGKKTGLKEAQWSPLADSERKDSLSVNVEFVKFHLSRSRKLNFHSDQQTGIKVVKSPDHGQAVIRFSTIIDIGSASFKYDMRRLTEILAFPKAWYRRSIVRRLFLGDLTTTATYSEEEESSPSSIEGDILSTHLSLGRNIDNKLQYPNLITSLTNSSQQFSKNHIQIPPSRRNILVYPKLPTQPQTTNNIKLKFSTLQQSHKV
uniref:Bridge-like lipid transfer protein family member 1 C-terminal domain-containing protein n=1 Tax=Timema poppense TaxID=170557 RepID=A0A7R9CFM5_TIMPO|nr:unnamed protein product [Timema poppensis]